MSRAPRRPAEKGRPHEAAAKTDAPVRPFGRSAVAGLLAACALSLGLNFFGITASLPNACNWVNDTIAGMNTVGQRARLFSTWTNKYPRVQFLVNSAAYEPFIRYWESHPVPTRDPQGRVVETPIDFQRMSTLSFVSLVITALMGAGAVAAVFLTGRLLFESDLAGFLAAAAMACMHEFVFYAHTGNTDVPAAFWYAWCVYWAAKALIFGKLRHYLLLAIFAVLAVGTKDPTVGFVVGLGAMVAARHVQLAREAGQKWPMAIAACVNGKTMAALAVFVFGFALVNNIITDPQGYLRRMSYWRGYDLAIWAKPQGLLTHVRLVGDAARDLWSAMGWPMLALAAGGLIHGFVKMPRKALLCIIPIVTFQLIVISQIRFATPRFYMPGYVGLALIAGAGAAALLRSGRTVKLAGIAALLFVYVTTFFYGLGASMDISRDTRVRVVEWFAANVEPKTAPVATLIAPWYGPYLPNGGFMNYAYPYVPPANWQTAGDAILPAYVVTGVPHQVYSASRPFWEALAGGKLPYEKVVTFEQRYFWPKKSIFGFAEWPMAHGRQSSPPIAVWMRK